MPGRGSGPLKCQKRLDGRRGLGIVNFRSQDSRAALQRAGADVVRSETCFRNHSRLGVELGGKDLFASTDVLNSSNGNPGIRLCLVVYPEIISQKGIFRDSRGSH